MTVVPRSEDLDASIVEVQGVDNAGTGFFVRDRTRVLTCSHVVLHRSRQMRGEQVPEYVSIRRPGDSQWHWCLVDKRSWSGIDGEDVALLRCFAYDESDGIHPLSLQAADLAPTVGTSFHSNGFPELGGIGPISFAGVVERATYNLRPGYASKLLQVTKSTGLTSGCSGAPAIDSTNGSLLGVVRMMATPDSYGALTEMAFLTPAGILAELHPDLVSADDRDRPMITLLDFRARRIDLLDDEAPVAVAVPESELGPWCYIGTTRERVLRVTVRNKGLTPDDQVDELKPFLGTGLSVSPGELYLIGYHQGGRVVSKFGLFGSDHLPKYMTTEGWKPYDEVKDLSKVKVEVRSASKLVIDSSGWAYYVSEVDRALWRIELDLPFRQQRLCKPPVKTDSTVGAPPDADLGLLRRDRVVIADKALGILWQAALDQPEDAAEVLVGGGDQSFEDGIHATSVTISPARLALAESAIYFATNDNGGGGRVFRYFDGRVWHVAGSGRSELFGETRDARQSDLGQVQSMAWLPNHGLIVAEGWPHSSVRVLQD